MSEEKKWKQNTGSSLTLALPKKEKEKKKNDEKDEEKGVPNFWVTAVKTNGVSVERDL